MGAKACQAAKVPKVMGLQLLLVSDSFLINLPEGAQLVNRLSQKTVPHKQPMAGGTGAVAMIMFFSLIKGKFPDSGVPQHKSFFVPHFVVQTTCTSLVVAQPPQVVGSFGTYICTSETRYLHTAYIQPALAFSPALHKGPSPTPYIMLAPFSTSALIIFALSALSACQTSRKYLIWADLTYVDYGALVVKPDKDSVLYGGDDFEVRWMPVNENDVSLSGLRIYYQTESSFVPEMDLVDVDAAKQIGKTSRCFCYVCCHQREGC
jgi:hypothetical protein